MGSPLKKCLRCYLRYLLRALLVTSCGSIAAVSRENAGDIPEIKMDKKYDNSKAVKETKIITAKKMSQVSLEILTESALSDILWFYRCNIKRKCGRNPRRKNG